MREKCVSLRKPGKSLLLFPQLTCTVKRKISLQIAIDFKNLKIVVFVGSMSFDHVST